MLNHHHSHRRRVHLLRLQIMDISDGELKQGEVLEGQDAEAVLEVIESLKKNKREAARQAEAEFLVASAERVEVFAEKVNEALTHPALAPLLMQAGSDSGRYFYRGLEFRAASKGPVGLGQLSDGGTFPPVPDA